MVSAKDLLARLATLDTCAVSDALDRLGLGGATTGIRPLWNCSRSVGRAVTIKIGPVGTRPPTEHLGISAIELAEAGDILVVDNGGRTDVAAWGGLLSVASKVKGLGAVVIDGVCRDLDEIRDVELPIYARGAVPLTARGRVMQVAVNGEVQIAGALVEPGDLVIADRSGVVFVASRQAEEIVAQAEALADWEKGVAAEIRKGRSLGEVLAGYELMLKKEEPDGSGGGRL